jgi:Tfp pilus assembly protein PilV
MMRHVVCFCHLANMKPILSHHNSWCVRQKRDDNLACPIHRVSVILDKCGWRNKATPIRGGNRALGSAGFSLTEVMIAASILVMVIGSAMTIVSHTSVYLGDLRMRSRSTHITQQAMEELRTKTWSQIMSYPTTFTPSGETNGNYAGRVTIDPYEAYQGTTTVVRATVSVIWTNRHGLPMTNSLTTLISNYGLNKTTL